MYADRVSKGGWQAQAGLMTDDMMRAINAGRGRNVEGGDARNRQIELNALNKSNGGQFAGGPPNNNIVTTNVAPQNPVQNYMSNTNNRMEMVLIPY